MIKYLELTAPERSEFRQAKILSVEVAEGDVVAKGDTLFKVKSGENEIDLPARMDGKIIEIIVLQDENISLLTPLVLLETEVEGSTATAPIIEGNDSKLSTGTSALAAKVGKKDKKTKKGKKSSKKKKGKKSKKARKNIADKVHQQQNLNLDLDPASASTSDTKPEQTSAADTIETKPMSTLQIKVPDIGAESAKVIEILVNVGDKINNDDPLVTLESDKASMDVPSTEAGVVSFIAVAVDQDVSEGTVIIELSVESTKSTEAPLQTEPDVESDTKQSEPAPATSQSNGEIAAVNVPDIGGDSAKVIEILVEVGQTISVEDALVTLESDKASMDVPSTLAGVVESIDVEIDQDVSEGATVVTIKTSDAPSEQIGGAKIDDSAEPTAADSGSPEGSVSTEGSVVDVVIPDIGGDAAKVIEILVSEGQKVELEDALVTLESDKASMDVPSSVAGTIQSIEIQLDQEVSEGMIVAKVLSAGLAQPAAAHKEPLAPVQEKSAPAPAPSPMATPQQTPVATGKSHASPSIRRFARELGVDLSKLGGSGRKGRIVKADVNAYVKNILQNGAPSSSAAASGSGIPAMPAIDFTKFGETDTQPLNRIKKLTAKNLHRSWLNVPHVTHNDESNISDLEVFRKQLNKEYAAQDKGIKLSPLAFIVKAVVHALRTYPQFNSSLSADGENIIYKKYINIGIAVETPNGLVVPVIRDADKMSVSEIANAMGELAKKARDKKLSPADMSGGCFTISSLGGIGGTSFTPIVNAPEVAILGVCRNKIQPVWDGEKFQPGTILPLSLSYDHRIIDGAEAARFTAHIAAALEDVRRLTV